MLYKERESAPYEGDEPYIFLSCSQRDAGEAAEIIRGLQDRHFRVWFRQPGPGEEWPALLADRIRRCACMIALVSESYISSKECRAELDFAFEHDRPRILVYLSDISLPDGMALLHDGARAICKKDYPQEDLFYAELSEAEELKEARGAMDRGSREARMPFEIQSVDILDFSGDAIINPTDEYISGGGGLDAQIHRTAGFRYWLETQKIRRLAKGRAAITRGGDLKCRYVIHTAAPRWTGAAREVELLRSCYRSSFALAARHGLKTVALPLIGSGNRGFPKELVLRVATEEIRAFLTTHEDTYILLAVHDRGSFQPNSALLSSLKAYIRNAGSAELQARRRDAMLDQASTGAFPAVQGHMHPVSAEEASLEPEEADEAREAAKPLFQQRPKAAGSLPASRRKAGAKPAPSHDASPAPPPPPQKRKDVLYDIGEIPGWERFTPQRGAILDESFSEMVMRKIDERGYKKDSDCYSKANIDRKLFSRIRCDKHYHPKKTTALALAVALELSLSETNELLMKAGYSLSHSIESDLIVEYCIRQKIYDIFKINELLFQYDQALLGG